MILYKREPYIKGYIIILVFTKNSNCGYICKMQQKKITYKNKSFFCNLCHFAVDGRVSHPSSPHFNHISVYYMALHFHYFLFITNPTQNFVDGNNLSINIFFIGNKRRTFFGNSLWYSPAFFAGIKLIELYRWNPIFLLNILL